MKISIIIPAFNEEKRLGNTVHHAVRFLETNYKNFEIILVDDGSTDGTFRLMKTFAREDPRIRVDRYGENRGKGFAVRTGVLAGSGDYIFFIDADGATPIEELPHFIKELSRGVPVVIGSRYLPKSSIYREQPFLRRILGKLANGTIRLVLLPGISDSQCGFKGFSKRAANALFRPLRIYRWGFDFEILTRARQLGYEIVEQPVHWVHQSGSRVRPIKSFYATFLELWYVFVVVRVLKL